MSEGSRGSTMLLGKSMFLIVGEGQQAAAEVQLAPMVLLETGGVMMSRSGKRKL